MADNNGFRPSSFLTERRNGESSAMKRLRSGEESPEDGITTRSLPTTHRRKATIPSKLPVRPMSDCSPAIPLHNIIEANRARVDDDEDDDDDDDGMSEIQQPMPVKRRRGRPPKNPNSTEISTNIKNCVSYMLSQVEMELEGRETPRRRPGRPPKSLLYRNVNDRSADGIRRRPGRPRGRMVSSGISRGRVGRPRLVRSQPYIPTFNNPPYFLPSTTTTTDTRNNADNTMNILNAAVQHYAFMTYMQALLSNQNNPSSSPLDNPMSVMAFALAAAAQASPPSVSSLVNSLMQNDRETVRQLLNSLQNTTQDEPTSQEGESL